ncbi:MAG: UDP-N-acetylmuramoyl-tripeptide--D-alanyl-D-alanine ligase [Planctomycetes bacterium]|nr:UDP-N-acetylmuramoyl-tripeptide--D-alanyl-D-alanine ligase [Planctomycetota bacterium]
MVAPLNPRSNARLVAGGDRGVRSALGTWLTPTAVAKAINGELVQRGRSGDGVTTDSRGDCTGKLFVALRGENYDGHDHVADAIRKGARGLIVSKPLHEIPGMDRSGPAFVVRVSDTSRALLELGAEHRRRNRAKVIGITGSCGKTTTKEWLGEVLSTGMSTVRSPASFNNQVGVPLTLFSIRPETRAAVVEIGTNAPGEIGMLTAVARPDIGIVTCVAPAHLEGLGSIEGVAREKGELPMGLDESGIAILNGDDPRCRAMQGNTRARVKFIAIDQQADWFATDLVHHAFGTTFKLQGTRPVTVPGVGTHSVYNSLFVIAAATELGMSEDAVLQALANVAPAARRLEPKYKAGVTVLDDTYNMNPASAHAGLQALAGMPGKGRRIVVFGEMRELGSDSYVLHQLLGHEVARSSLDMFIAVGAAEPIAAGAIAAGMKPETVHRAACIEDALQLLLNEVRPLDRILCKASRKVGLDLLVDRLLAELGGGAVASNGGAR